MTFTVRDEANAVEVPDDVDFSDMVKVELPTVPGDMAEFAPPPKP